MKLTLLALTVALLMSACTTYDPENYDKIHDQEFEDHLRQNGGDGGDGGSGGAAE